ncbi:MAG: sigma-70 family RNA polymerase sigma factor [Clostridia bacterium]|jgi:RNA polymerase sigma factor (sigma-70 family)|nr:sigma-70 family RNA polymerase sigma factor [Clostridia bacterium]MCI1999020.1 sigma-70 family RNA polymerase sigma factor [Clostridia bacterium]MCI2013770.1 sigma-70 family RNA polymerase sigma factor [Clostridia bacterium]
MTNEELAERVQAGDNELLPLLWEHVSKLVRLKVNEYMTSRAETCQRSGVTFDDLFNEGYIAFTEAISAYKPTQGYKFTSYINYPLLNRCNEALGLRTSAGKHNILNNSVSLDMPIGDDENGATLEDIVPDDDNSFLEADEKIYNVGLHDDLEKCFKELPENEERVIRLRYYNNATYEAIGNETGNSRQNARQLEHKALRKLRKGRSIARLRAYRDDIISTHAYKSSFERWKNSGYSSTEYTALRLCGYSNKELINAIDL